MKSYLQPLVTGFLTLLFIFSTVAVGSSQSIVKAQIGIQVQSNGSSTRAKKRNRIKVGDGLRLYVTPAEDAYLYILRTHKQRVQALNRPPYIVTGKTPVVLPGEAEFYNIDGSSPHESFTVICSPTPLKEVEDLIKTSTPSLAQWTPTERLLIKISRMHLTENVDKPFPIAGVVRSLKTDSEFLKQLPTFSGKTLVVKKYDFTLKK